MNNMTFFGAIKNVFINYFNFRGRARRKEFWYFIPLCNINYYALKYVTNNMSSFLTADSSASTEIAATTPDGTVVAYFFMTIVLLVIALILLIPSISVSVRRLHDIGKSGWWFLLGFIPIGPIVLLAWFCKDSQPGVNKWGENPKGVNGDNNINEQTPTA